MSLVLYMLKLLSESLKKKHTVSKKRESKSLNKVKKQLKKRKQNPKKRSSISLNENKKQP